MVAGEGEKEGGKHHHPLVGGGVLSSPKGQALKLRREFNTIHAAFLLLLL